MSFSCFIFINFAFAEHKLATRKLIKQKYPKNTYILTLLTFKNRYYIKYFGSLI
jgi:hypothetical protein